MTSAKWIFLIFVIIVTIFSCGTGKTLQDEDDVREVPRENSDYEKSPGKFKRYTILKNVLRLMKLSIPF